eukprot:COSAG01_NODE_171_length_23132_cov_53.865118_17_plen_43_part_00
MARSSRCAVRAAATKPTRKTPQCAPLLHRLDACPEPRLVPTV